MHRSDSSVMLTCFTVTVTFLRKNALLTTNVSESSSEWLPINPATKTKEKTPLLNFVCALCSYVAVTIIVIVTLTFTSINTATAAATTMSRSRSFPRSRTLSLKLSPSLILWLSLPLPRKLSLSQLPSSAETLSLLLSIWTFRV